MKRFVVLFSVLFTSLASLAAPVMQAENDIDHKVGHTCFEAASIPNAPGDVIEELCF